ncbi:methionine biosynthesis protein MetW [uncultured Salinisphaera sp.]|uniref:methionine biosynthesis protein MetW n=1 Tax=uncultured Salinisphaera sp. TaxID=359372 RepID=UPI0032B2DA4F
MNTHTTDSHDGLRDDLALISNWITPGARVLDLGCGDGALLAHLQAHKQVSGYGLEIDADNVIECVAAGVNVLQLDLDAGLEQFEDNSFDFVVMSSALQEVRRPDELVDEMLRIGRDSIVTFPNFGHWKPRVSLGLRGLMPVSGSLPNRWYDTPNIHLCTVRDFETLCRQKQVDIVRRHVVNHAHRSNIGMRTFPNLLGEIALYQLRHHATA